MSVSLEMEFKVCVLPVRLLGATMTVVGLLIFMVVFALAFAFAVAVVGVVSNVDVKDLKSVRTLNWSTSFSMCRWRVRNLGCHTHKKKNQTIKNYQSKA